MNEIRAPVACIPKKNEAKISVNRLFRELHRNATLFRRGEALLLVEPPT